MSIQGWKKLLLCAVLELAALTGAPLRPRDIEAALSAGTAVATHKQSEEHDAEQD